MINFKIIIATCLTILTIEGTILNIYIGLMVRKHNIENIKNDIKEE